MKKLKNEICAQMRFMWGGVQNVWEEEVESSNTKSAELNVVNAIKASDVNTNNTQNEKVRFFLLFVILLFYFAIVMWC